MSARTKPVHESVACKNAQVLGVTGDTTDAITAELYNPATGKWILTGISAAFHEGHWSNGSRKFERAEKAECRDHEA
jgi:hypothetical protein